MEDEQQKEFYFAPPNSKVIGTYAEDYEGAIAAFIALLDANGYNANPLILEEFVLTKDEFELVRGFNFEEICPT